MAFQHALPAIPVSCGAILLDEGGRLLILKPTYKKGWTIPGGVMEADGETPWEGCRREVAEETGLAVASGRLVVVDTRGAKKDEQLGLRLLFHCGTITAEQAASIRLQETEISRHRFVAADEAQELLRPRIARRVAAGLAATSTVYLEDGHPVDGVGTGAP
ncbi:NUDIX domain-containing protein [Nigerium massiliense]|uniref:NUDIX domain-containing protein n=1 Tax=Nigerium massiliense TaxID=1522317 RepID=UPI00058DAD2D|nr:NUDIX hydrolase [Nigerium massiliense]